MPKLRQPTSLQTIAFDGLVDRLVICCDQLSAQGSFDKLRKTIEVIKEDFCRKLPWYLLKNFCTKILCDFYSPTRPASHNKAVVQIIMDVKIAGLMIKHQGPILGYLDSRDFHRIQQLEELEVVYFVLTKHMELANFPLNNLTRFKFSIVCDDLDLKIIGQNCPSLEVLEICHSKVTDAGLRALDSCSALRVVDLTYCTSVTHVGINHLLSRHGKLEKLIFRKNKYSNLPADYDVLSNLDWSVQCPAINQFVIDSSSITKEHLELIIAKFPNLSHVTIYGPGTQYLASLQALDNLTALDVSFSNERYATSWVSFETLLTSIGPKLTSLTLSAPDQTSCFRQNELNYIFSHCPNIEYLELDHAERENRLVVPAFKKLREYHPRLSNKLWEPLSHRNQVLEFGVMPELEVLSLYGYNLSRQYVQSIILDHVRFPNLSEIRINMEQADLVRKIVRDNNLDVKVVDNQRYFDESYARHFCEYQFR